MEDIRLSDKNADIDFEFVYRFLNEESIWAQGIGRQTLQRSIDHSLCISAFSADSQIGFVRATTDYATFAWVDDLFVIPQVRKKGIAKQLVETLTNHTSLNSVASWWTCSSNPNARSLFAAFGFLEPDQQRIAKWIGRPKHKSDSYKR